jgi:hypothetical protein
VDSWIVGLDGRGLDRGAVVPPSRFDPAVRALSAVAGGPAGRRLGAARGFWRASTVLVLLAMLTTGAAVLAKQHCRAHGWSSPDQFWHACYSDTAVLYGSAGLGAADRPGLADAVRPDGLGQPPLAGAAMWAVSSVVTSVGKAGARLFFDISALLLAVALAAGVVMLASAAGRRPWDAAHLALSPVLVASALISYQMLGVTLAVAALLAWSRRRPVLGGVLLGLGVAAAPAVGVLAPAVLAYAIRAGRGGAGGRFAAVTAASWFGVRLVLFSGLGGGLADAWQKWKAAGPGYGSIWLVPQLMAGSRPRWAGWWFGAQPLGGPTATTLAVLGLLAVVGGVVALALTAPAAPRLGPLALLLLAGTLLVSKSLPPQASLVLLPAIGLAGLRWRDHFLWATTEITYFIGVWLYIAASSDANRGLPVGGYLLLLLARLGGIAWLGIQAARAVLDPATDVGRLAAADAVGGPDDSDDSAGAQAGPVDGFRDRPRAGLP